MSPKMGIHQTNIVCFQVDSTILAKVIEWCEHHRNDPPGDDAEHDEKHISPYMCKDLEQWDKEFLDVEQETLFNIILVCTFPSLLSCILITTMHDT